MKRRIVATLICLFVLVSFGTAFAGGELVIPTKEDRINPWQDFYFQVFGEKYDFSKIQISDPPDGPWWLLVVPEEVTLDKVSQKYQETFGGEKYGASKHVLDVFAWSKQGTGTYAIWITDYSHGGTEIQIKTDQRESKLAELFYSWQIDRAMGKYLKK